MPKTSKIQQHLRKLDTVVQRLESKLAATRPNKKKPKVKKRNKAKNQNAIAPLHPLGQQLLVGLASPFSSEAQGVKVIGPGATPSQTWFGRSLTRFTCQNGGRNIHFINPSHRDPFVTYNIVMSSSGLGAKYFDTVANANAEYTTCDVKRPYDNSGLTAANAGARIVSVGIKIRYIGIAQNRAGTITWYDDTSLAGDNIFKIGSEAGIITPSSINGTLSMTDLNTRISSYPATRVVNFINSDTHEFHHHPIPSEAGRIAGTNQMYATLNWTALDLQLNGADITQMAPFGNATESNGKWYYQNNLTLPRAILIVEGATASVPYTLEVILHMEYMGGSLLSFHTPSPMHLEADAEVRQTIVRSRETHSIDPDKHPFHHVMDELKRTVSARQKLGSLNLASTLKATAASTSAKTMLATGIAGMLL